MMNVMTRAWEIYRTLTGDHIAKLAMALRMAWAEIKATAAKVVFDKFAKIVIPGREHYDDQASKFVYFKAWSNYGKNRIYINDYKTRTIGYIENGVFTLKDNNGFTAADINTMVNAFCTKYAF